ncbi:protein far1-related sequence 11-like [Gigaspora margarita]|uniref:Protein far1-related sequence 11-like n=1 Tax=Gigaspora margarita TaxID=4874 RepID=A0A8H4AHT6_GIGMA|nr:protein far1-related sequence 11-like [Gigaspora margarita]
MKKILNLAIATGRIEELYAIHKGFVSKIKNEVLSQVRCDDNITEFTLTINNLISIKTKSQPKDSNNTNADIKGKRKQIPGSYQEDKENKAKRPRKILQDTELNVSESSKFKERKCGICNEGGHNTHTCLRGS